MRLLVSLHELPSAALMPELARGYDERTALVGLRSLFANVGAGLSFVLAFGVFLRSTPEHRKILARCQQQATVADIASETALPLGVVRVLLADLMAQGAVAVVRQRPAGQRTGNDVLQEILNGLRAL